MFKFRSLYSPRPAKKQKDPKASPLLVRIARRFVMGLGILVLMMLVYVFVVASVFQSSSSVPELPEQVVLYLKIDQPIVEQAPKSAFMNPFAPPPPTLRQIVETIDLAVDDDRVKGLYVRLADGSFNITQAQEIREAVKRFEAAGKSTAIYASSYGGGGNGLPRIYLASAFQERWMQPMGVVTMAGVRAEVPFFKDLLNKIGVAPYFYQRKEYKTAYESFTNEGMSEANRESMEDIVASIRDVVLTDMPEDIGIGRTAFENLVDKGLLLSDEALKAKVITHADYVDVLIENMRETYQGDRLSEEPLFVTLNAYAGNVAHQKAAKKTVSKPVVALVYVTGAIMESNPNGRQIAAADEVAPVILDAAKDEAVKAIVLRVDSPGGSPVASESILRALIKAKDAGKPVIVSMGSVAASGGYWVAAGADKIYALPTTMTGSIGVVGGKFAADGVWDKVGVNWDRSIQWGDNAGMWSINEGFTESQEERVNAMLDDVYGAFISRVAAGRGMSLEEADAVAKGRVWPGSLAMERGLVDEMGGLQDAFAHVANMLGAERPQDLQIVEMPRPLTPFEQIMELLSEQGMVMEGLKYQSQILGAFRPYLNDVAVMQNGGPALAYEPMAVR